MESKTPEDRYLDEVIENYKKLDGKWKAAYRQRELSKCCEMGDDLVKAWQVYQEVVFKCPPVGEAAPDKTDL